MTLGALLVAELEAGANTYLLYFFSSSSASLSFVKSIQTNPVSGGAHGGRYILHKRRSPLA